MKKLLITPQNPNGILLDLTAEEINQIETDKQSALLDKQKEESNETAKANGNQKLLDLGLTQEEATALTGYVPPKE